MMMYNFLLQVFKYAGWTRIWWSQAEKIRDTFVNLLEVWLLFWCVCLICYDKRICIFVQKCAVVGCFSVNTNVQCNVGIICKSLHYFFYIFVLFMLHLYTWILMRSFLCSLIKEAPQLGSSNDNSGKVVFDQKFLDKLEEVKKYEF